MSQKYSISELRRYIKENSLIVETGCWIWGRATNSRDYGTAWNGKKNVLAHRLSYEAFKGNPEGFLVCHKCDVTLCVNPNHLFLGTNADNSKDAYRKGRNPNQKVSRFGKHEMASMVTSKTPYAVIARKLNISRAAISYWKNRGFNDE